ncbi:hypothetical protein [Mycobacterium vicinigordonae]|uniref:Uncharacterized protein n=1 Tax=Mycobacterium vicinigordonae TaxID=1719132 RepID=A0A7D6HM14_9MYCO|nr:hypothetical protein [Mycobacterium vicinigordonae]QLL05591.1 hypothetical protein H0P51_17295 [Mycobacterium vicinigordonae]
MTGYLSAITAANRTPAGQRRGKPEPVPTFTQEQWRERRRKLLITRRVRSFSPSREIAEAAVPLAERIAALAARPPVSSGPPVSLRFRSPIAAFADAVHELVSGVTGWQAEQDGMAKTAHLAAEPGKRRHALTLLKDTAQRPVLPSITDQMITDGSWAAALTEIATAADGLRVAAAHSYRLERLLLNTIDRAAGDLERRIAFAEKQRPSVQPAPDTRAELESLGVNL